MYLAPVAKANQEQQPKGRAVKKRLTIVCLGIVLVAGVVLVGRPIYEQRRITSAMAKLKDEDSPVEERIKAAARLVAVRKLASCLYLWCDRAGQPSKIADDLVRRQRLLTQGGW